MSHSKSSPLPRCSSLPRCRGSLDFYSKNGFTEHSLWGEPTCFAMVRRGGYEIMLSLVESAIATAPTARQTFGTCISVWRT